MTSFEDYDEFGNYIGADLDSDDDDEVLQEQYGQQPETAPLEGFDDEQRQEVEEEALMEVDGTCWVFIPQNLCQSLS